LRAQKNYGRLPNQATEKRAKGSVPIKPEMRGAKMRRRDDNELEKLAWQLRGELGLANVYRLDGMTLLTRLKATFKGFNYRRVHDGSLGSAEAQYDSAERCISITESTLGSLSDFEVDHSRGARALFTLAHEVSHFVLKHDGRLNRAFERAAYEKASAKYRALETDADSFAACLLAPMRLIDPLWPVETIQRKFGISRRAAEIRLGEKQREQRFLEGKKRPLPAGVREFLREMKQKGYDIQADLDGNE